MIFELGFTGKFMPASGFEHVNDVTFLRSISVNNILFFNVSNRLMIDEKSLDGCVLQRLKAQQGYNFIKKYVGGGNEC